MYVDDGKEHWLKYLPSIACTKEQKKSFVSSFCCDFEAALDAMVPLDQRVGTVYLIQLW